MLGIEVCSEPFGFTLFEAITPEVEALARAIFVFDAHDLEVGDCHGNPGAAGSSFWLSIAKDDIEAYGNFGAVYASVLASIEDGVFAGAIKDFIIPAVFLIGIHTNTSFLKVQSLIHTHRDII